MCRYPRFILGAQEPWSFVLLATAIPLFAGFLLSERRTATGGGRPLLPLSLLRISPYASGNALFLLFFAANAGFYFVLAVHLQNALGYTPFVAGLTFAPLAVAFTVTSFVTPAVQRRVGPQVLVLGYGLNALGFVLLWVLVQVTGGSASGLALAPLLAIIGFGQGLGVGPLLGTALATIPAEQMGTAAGALETTGQVGMTLGVAAVGAAYFGTSGGGASFPAATALAALLAVTAVACVRPLVHGAADRPEPEPATERKT